jgi:hypothetical protein
MADCTSAPVQMAAIPTINTMATTRPRIEDALNGMINVRIPRSHRRGNKRN